MRKIFIAVTFIFAVFQLFSQVDNTENRILNDENSKSVIISKGRNLLLDKFLEGDMEKVKEVKDYLIKIEDENYIALFPAEYWFILYWTHEYEELLSSIRTFDSATIASYRTRIRPAYDMLNTKLRTKSVEDAAKITIQIQLADINSEEKEVLRLNFDMLTTGEPSQDALNDLADIFLKTYPETEYKDFVQKHVRYKLVPKNWGFALEFFTGYGIFTGRLAKDYTNIIPLGFAFDICYKKIELYMRYYIGLNKTKKDFDYSTGTYKKGSSINVFLPEASLGYAALDNDRFKASPFLGIGAMDISPPVGKTEKNPELDEISLKFTTTYMMGVNFDIKFGKRDYLFRPKSSYPFLRVRYTCNITRFPKKYDGISGNMHSITIGFGVMERKLKREY